MCGLTLLINKNRNGFNAQQQDVFSTLMYLSGGFRGRDGAGVVVVDNIGNVKLAKDAATVDEFIRTTEYDELDKYAFQKGWAMIGHNRYATKGVISDKNSHPFVIDDKIVLVHNGTFNGDHKAIKDTEVDSEAIGHALAEAEDVEQALRRVNAAYALIWYNVDKKEINVIRNMQRPLWYMETTNSYVFSSEKIYLQFVIEKYNLKPEDGPFEIKEYALSTFKLKDNKDTDASYKDLDVSYWKHNKTSVGETCAAPFTRHGGGNSMTTFEKFVASKYSPVGLIHSQKIIDRVVACIGANAKPTLYSQWIGQLSPKYSGNTVRVLVNDIVEADDDPKGKDFILMGHTMDEFRMHVAFPIFNATLQDASALANSAVFDVDVSGVTWRRVDHLWPVDQRNNFSEWEGLALIHGGTPRPVYMLENTSVQ